MPAVIGYLAVGVALGPHGFDLIESAEDTRFLAELGLIFLMFMVGLEFSIPAILRARWDVLVAGDVVVADRRPTRVDVRDVRAQALEHVGGA